MQPNYLLLAVAFQKALRASRDAQRYAETVTRREFNNEEIGSLPITPHFSENAGKTDVQRRNKI
jgi:hypothetical protein